MITGGLFSQAIGGMMGMIGGGIVESNRQAWIAAELGKTQTDLGHKFIREEESGYKGHPLIQDDSIVHLASSSSDVSEAVNSWKNLWLENLNRSVEDGRKVVESLEETAEKGKKGAGDFVASETVQKTGEYAGYIPTAPTQALSTAITVADAVLNENVAPAAGEAAGAIAETFVDGKLKKMATSTVVGMAVEVVVDNVIESKGMKEN